MLYKTLFNKTEITKNAVCVKVDQNTIPCNSQTFKGIISLLLSIRYFWNAVRLSLRSEYLSLH